ncbi:mitochondrial 37S ribosomal protein rsm10 [Linnemannia gamsii]|uniref:Mitochondrial 37S ribosomal protein rsm10 n=1 Tax=Linnemannia gamsii TaxID=64522 RepID=A0ABQ7JQF8_9FUNG|nr:mitochondrial 37S ribosomal protein rsm10 [Linnemannia gamsii]
MLSSLRTSLSAQGMASAKKSVVAIASRSVSTSAAKNVLPEDMSAEDRLVYGEPVQIPTTHNITVAHLHLRSYLPHQLEFFTDFARRAAAALEMPCSGAIPLPVQTSKWTVNKSPFIYKKAQETFERKTHKRLLAIKDTHPDVVRRWVQFLNQNAIAGVGMKVTVWENEELGVGQKKMEKAMKGESRNRSVAAMMAEGEEPSKEVKAVADQLLAEMMKDIGGEEEITKAQQQDSKPSSPAAAAPETVESSEQATESNITDVVEPLVSGSSTLDPELSNAVEKAVAETATKSDKN